MLLTSGLAIVKLLLLFVARTQVRHETGESRGTQIDVVTTTVTMIAVAIGIGRMSLAGAGVVCGE